MALKHLQTLHTHLTHTPYTIPNRPNTPQVHHTLTCRQSPVSVSHIRAVLSEDAVKIRVPCGLNATLDISPSWPARMAWQAPVIVLYTREFPSAEAVTSFEPVALNDTSRISSLCPRRVWMQVPLCTSQTYSSTATHHAQHIQLPFQTRLLDTIVDILQLHYIYARQALLQVGGRRGGGESARQTLQTARPPTLQVRSIEPLIHKSEA